MEFSGWNLQELCELADISRSKPKLMTLDLWSEVSDHSYSDANVFESAGFLSVANICILIGDPVIKR
jgi:hypothetical protein